MTIILDGNCTFPVREYHGNFPVEINDLPVSDVTKNRLSIWASEYCKYISMNLIELTLFSKEIEELDIQGMNILRKLHEEWNNHEIDKFYYFSLCKDKLMLVVYRNNKEKLF